MEAREENMAVQAEGRVQVTWTSAMSTFMLHNLADIVANGTRTSTGFKSVHYNSCARALNDHFRLRLNGAQINNHHKTWKRKYAKILHIKNTHSGALWDDVNCIIRLEHEHYMGYIKDHKADVEYLNKPIENYCEMAIIFGNSLATGKYAKGSSEPLGTDVTHIEEEEEGNENEHEYVAGEVHSTNVGESSATKPSKRAKSSDHKEDDGLISILTRVDDRLAMEIENAGAKSAPPPPQYDIPENLFETLQSLPGFDETQISHYFAHLVENPRSARAFIKEHS